MNESVGRHKVTFREGGRSQWVDATLAGRLLEGAWEANFLRRH